MAHYLVIVESPAKVKTIKKFLGSNYTVAASQGHVRDLPKSSLGIDVEHDYEPKYITIRGKGDILAALRKEAKKSDKVFLATDPDREGEAISWHLATALKLDEKKMRRITFNEITKNAVKASLKAPRDIDMNLVDAPQVFQCMTCGNKERHAVFSAVKGGLVCSECMKDVRDGMSLDPSTLYSMQYIETSTIEKLYTFNVTEKVLTELGNVMSRMTDIYVGKHFKSLEILETLI